MAYYTFIKANHLAYIDVVAILSQIKTTREERRLQVQLLPLPSLLLLSIQMFNRNFNQQSRDHLLPYQIHPSRNPVWYSEQRKSKQAEKQKHFISYR